MKMHIAYLGWNDVEVEVPEKWERFMTLYNKDWGDLTEEEMEYLYKHRRTHSIYEEILGFDIEDYDDVYIVEEDA